MNPLIQGKKIGNWYHIQFVFDEFEQECIFEVWFEEKNEENIHLDSANWTETSKVKFIINEPDSTALFNAATNYIGTYLK